MALEGWREVTLGDVGKIVTGKTPKRKNPEFFEGEHPFVKPSDLDKEIYVSESDETLSDIGLKSVPNLPIGAVMVTCIGNMGKVGIAGKIVATNQQINSIIPNDKIINSKYLYYYAKTLKPWMDRESSSTTIAIINKSKFSTAPILLPPLKEQKQIAQKLDQVLARVERIKTALDNAPATIKRFRQSVLASGTSGGLIEKNEKWEDVTIDDILDNIRYGTSKKCSYDDTLTPVLRIPNIKDSKINTEDIKSANFNEKEFETLALKVGDILVIRSNGSIDLVGKNVVVTKEHENYIFAGYLIRVRLNMTFANPKYIHYVLSSPQTREVINLTAKSTSGVNNLNSKEIGAFKVSLPPLQEQKAIVKKIETLFAIADNLEAKVTQAQQRVDRLTLSILAKAFRGEL
jgi:type I restriction enzyme S subunit